MSRMLIFEASHRIERLIYDCDCLKSFAKEWWRIDTLSVDSKMDAEKIMSCFKQVATLTDRVWKDMEEKNLIPDSRDSDLSNIDDIAAYLILHQNLSNLGTLLVGMWLKRLKKRKRGMRERILDFWTGG